MKPFRYLLVVGFVLQLFCMRGLCALRPSSPHDCCPPAQGSQTPNAPPLPDCCVASVLRDTSSLAKVQTSHQTVRPLTTAVRASIEGLVPNAVARPLASRVLSQPISLPLSPLLRTCLLLI